MGLIETYLICAVVFWLYNWLVLYPDVFGELIWYSKETNNIELYNALGGPVRLIISTLLTNILIWPFSLVMLLILGIKRYREQFIEVYKKRYANK